MIPHTLQIVVHSDPDEIVHDNSHYLSRHRKIYVSQGTFATRSYWFVGAEGDSDRRTTHRMTGQIG